MIESFIKLIRNFVDYLKASIDTTFTARALEVTNQTDSTLSVSLETASEQQISVRKDLTDYSLQAFPHIQSNTALVGTGITKIIQPGTFIGTVTISSHDSGTTLQGGLTADFNDSDVETIQFNSSTFAGVCFKKVIVVNGVLDYSLPISLTLGGGSTGSCCLTISYRQPVSTVVEVVQ